MTTLDDRTQGHVQAGTSGATGVVSGGNVAIPKPLFSRRGSYEYWFERMNEKSDTTPPPQPNIPRVFISSTSADLGPYRDAAKEAAVGAEMLPVMMEYFTAAGDRPPLAKCLAEVDRADLLVVIVAHRYGWVPPDQPDDEKKSITWLECEQAVARGREVLAFIIDDKQNWPEELKESYRLTKAMQDGSATAELFTEVNDYVARLQQLKAWFNDRAIRNTFTSPENLRRQVSEALSGWRTRHETASPAAAATGPPADPNRYLRWLLEQTSHIDIRGLQVGTGRVHRFHIEDLFITLTTTC